MLIRYLDYSFFVLPTIQQAMASFVIQVRTSTCYICPLGVENKFTIFFAHILILIFLQFICVVAYFFIIAFQPNSQEMPRSLVSTPSISPPRSSTIVPEKEIAPYSVRNMTLSLSIGHIGIVQMVMTSCTSIRFPHIQQMHASFALTKHHIIIYL